MKVIGHPSVGPSASAAHAAPGLDLARRVRASDSVARRSSPGTVARFFARISTRVKVSDPIGEWKAAVAAGAVLRELDGDKSLEMGGSKVWQRLAELPPVKEGTARQWPSFTARSNQSLLALNARLDEALAKVKAGNPVLRPAEVRDLMSLQEAIHVEAHRRGEIAGNKSLDVFAAACPKSGSITMDIAAATRRGEVQSVGNALTHTFIQDMTPHSVAGFVDAVALSAASYGEHQQMTGSAARSSTLENTRKLIAETGCLLVDCQAEQLDTLQLHALDAAFVQLKSEDGRKLVAQELDKRSQSPAN